MNRCPGRAVVRTLNYPVAAAGGQRFELVQRPVGQRRVSAWQLAPRDSEDARHLLVPDRTPKWLRWVSASSAALRLQGDIVVPLIFGQVAEGLRFLQILLFGMGGFRDHE